MVVSIGYSVTFDTVSHKFLDKAMEESGMSNKARTMFRTVYRNAEAFTTVQDAESRKQDGRLENISSSHTGGAGRHYISSVLHSCPGQDPKGPR